MKNSKLITDRPFIDGGQIDKIFKTYSTYWATYLSIEAWGFKNSNNIFLCDMLDKVETRFQRLPKIGNDLVKISEIAKYIYSRIGQEFFEEDVETINDFIGVVNEPVSDIEVLK